MKWELALAVCDEEDLESGHKRKKEGDIITYMPHPHEWGKMETNEFLIVIVEGSEEDIRELCEPLNKTGNLKKDIKYKSEIRTDKEGAPFVVDVINDPEDEIIISKRRYAFDFSKFKNIELDRVRDKKDHYQPFKEKDEVTELTSIKDKHTLRDI